MNIGNFQNAANGRITGEIDALLIGRVKVTFEPHGKGVDYTVLTDTGCEVGAAWNKTAEKLLDRWQNGDIEEVIHELAVAVDAAKGGAA